MERVEKIMKASSDLTRLRIIMALRERELCVCQLIAMLELAPSTVSKHMSILKEAGLVKSRKEKQWIYYSLSNIFDESYSAKVLSLIVEELKEDRQVIRDRERLEEVLAENQKSLCEKVCNR